MFLSSNLSSRDIAHFVLFWHHDAFSWRLGGKLIKSGGVSFPFWETSVCFAQTLCNFGQFHPFLAGNQTPCKQHRKTACWFSNKQWSVMNVENRNNLQNDRILICTIWQYTRLTILFTNFKSTILPLSWCILSFHLTVQVGMLRVKRSEKGTTRRKWELLLVIFYSFSDWTWKIVKENTKSEVSWRQILIRICRDMWKTTKCWL